MSQRCTRRYIVALGASLVLLTGACGLREFPATSPVAHLQAGQQGGSEASGDRTSGSAYAVPEPGSLDGSLLSPDLLVVGERAIPGSVRDTVRELDGVRSAIRLSVASVKLGERTITVAGVDSADYRRFAPEGTAAEDAVWQSVARGEAIISHQVGRDFHQRLGGQLALRNQAEEFSLRIGAYATTVPHIDAVVNDKRAEQLGMRSRNALLLSVRGDDVDAVERAVSAAVGERASVQRLREGTPKEGTRQAAYLSGGSVARAVGSFRYQYFADGTVAPDPRWVAANIRTETVPILGRLTCHKVMLAQLREALAEVVDRGLAGAIDPGDYGGCYVPRFIGHDPDRGLSLHTWGIAIDLNVQTNQRGTVGEIDRDVVAIFKRWGFAWGGDWEWTDPMHFELAALVRR